jgi:hypothetical protein
MMSRDHFVRLEGEDGGNGVGKLWSSLRGFLFPPKASQFSSQPRQLAFSLRCPGLGYASLDLRFGGRQ